jgi:hypothetical protein
VTRRARAAPLEQRVGGDRGAELHVQAGTARRAPAGVLAQQLWTPRGRVVGAACACAAAPRATATTSVKVPPRSIEKLHSFKCFSGTGAAVQCGAQVERAGAAVQTRGAG